MNSFFIRTFGLSLAVSVGLVASHQAGWATVQRAGTIGTPTSALPPEMADIGIEEQLGKNVSIETLSFRNEKGESVPLKQFFQSKKPVLLNLVYFECPSLCTLALNGLVKSLQALDWTVGDKFEVITLSIDPKETAELAADKKEAYVGMYGRGNQSISDGWHFLTGEKDQIEKIASEVGFKYRYDEKTKEYAHAAGTFILTPEGKVSRVLYGVEFTPKDLKLGLLEASDGKIGTVVDRFMLFCYSYNPMTRTYSLVAMRMVQVGFVGLVLFLGVYLSIFWRRQRRL